MNNTEIEQWLAWVDDTFGLDFKDEDDRSVAYLWGRPLCLSHEGEKFKVASTFAHQTYLLFKEWRNYNA